MISANPAAETVGIGSTIGRLEGDNHARHRAGTEVKQAAEQLLAQEPDWVSFYREILARTVWSATRTHPRNARRLRAVRDLPRDSAVAQPAPRAWPVSPEEAEATRVITVRLPRSLHEALRVEAHEHRTSMNKLCISKLLQFVDGRTCRANEKSGADL